MRGYKQKFKILKFLKKFLKLSKKNNKCYQAIPFFENDPKTDSELEEIIENENIFEEKNENSALNARLEAMLVPFPSAGRRSKLRFEDFTK